MPELAPLPSHITGPTWQKTVDGAWHSPTYTLGWQIINWMYKYLRQPGGDYAGEPFIPTFEQARFIVWWYAVGASGRFEYRTGVFRRMKGHGKDPLLAAIALAELCGPVIFSKWDAKGEPVGKARPEAWIQIAGVSQDQTRNTFQLFPSMASKELRQEYGLELHKTIIHAKYGGLIEGVTSSPLALEGKRPTLVIPNEIQWWLENNQGHEMYNVINGNVVKGATSRILAICNAHRPGEDSVGERMWDAYQSYLAGDTPEYGMLYDALEAPADTPISEIPHFEEDPDGHEAGVEKLREGLKIASGDSSWLPIEDIISSIFDPGNSVSESRRKFLNQINAVEDAWISPSEWNARHEDVKLQPKDTITLGFDGSKSQDTTALVACRVEDGALFLLKLWNPANTASGEVPREQIDASVRSAFERYNVVGFRADVHEFEAYVDQWSRDFSKRLKVKASPGKPVAFDMRGQKKAFALDCERFLDAAFEGDLCHDGNETLKQHVVNARRNPTTYDAISIRKASKDSSRKIDAAVSAVLAFGSRQDYLMSKYNRGNKVTVVR